MNFTQAVDSVLGVLSPRTLLARERNRAALNILQKSRGYNAASQGRRTSDWNAPGTSANIETMMALSVLRNRSRELVRNNAYAKRAIQAISSNTVGTGIVPVINDSIGPKTAVKRIKKAWDDWAGTTECDWDGQTDFYGLQNLALRSIAESGEVLILKRKVKKYSTIPIKLQVVEADFIDTSRNYNPGFKPDEYCIQGVVFNADGTKKGYYLYKSHPGEGFYNESKFVPKEDVCHVYFKERPGQVRGIPWGSSAALALKDYDDYEDAQLIRQKIAACFTVFVSDATGQSSGDYDLLEKVEPGIIEHLPGGKQVTFADPPTVNNYEEYSRSMLRKVAVGYGVPYETLTGDMSNANFSQARMGWIEFHRLISEWRNTMIIPMLCDPVWNWFIEACVIAGVTRQEVKVKTWTPPLREMIDPSKEVKALGEAIRYGQDSWQNAVRKSGRDPKEVLQEMKEDADAFDKAGLMPASDPRFDTNRGSDEKTKDSTGKDDEDNDD